jgi:hypothetical protein
MSVKLVSTFADRWCRVVSATDPQGRILGFLDRSRYYLFQVAPQFCSTLLTDAEFTLPGPSYLVNLASA